MKAKWFDILVTVHVAKFCVLEVEGQSSFGGLLAVLHETRRADGSKNDHSSTITTNLTLIRVIFNSFLNYHHTCHIAAKEYDRSLGRQVTRVQSHMVT